MVKLSRTTLFFFFASLGLVAFSGVTAFSLTTRLAVRAAGFDLVGAVWTGFALLGALTFFADAVTVLVGVAAVFDGAVFLTGVTAGLADAGALALAGAADLTAAGLATGATTFAVVTICPFSTGAGSTADTGTALRLALTAGVESSGMVFIFKEIRIGLSISIYRIIV